MIEQGKERNLKHEQKQKQKERCARFLLDMFIKYGPEVKKENQEIKSFYAVYGYRETAYGPSYRCSKRE